MTILRRGIVLVALDTSERAPRVLAAAAEVARRFHAKLSLFRAVGVPVDVPPEAFSVTPQALEGILLQHAEETLRRLAVDLPESIVSGYRVVEGTPWRSIVHEAEQEKADMIVIGSHGYGGIDRLLGTTAARVVNHAPCSVLVVNTRD